jgi:hypothetical protein
MNQTNKGQAPIITKPPPRTHGTPSGYRNIRVLVPIFLHFRLSSYAALSHTSLPEFISRWLTLVTPLDPITGQPLAAEKQTGAPGLELGKDAEACSGFGSMPSATNIVKGATPRPLTIAGPFGGPPLAQGPGKAHPPGAGSMSAHDPGTVPSSFEASPIVSVVRSDPGQCENQAKAEGDTNA